MKPLVPGGYVGGPAITKWQHSPAPTTSAAAKDQLTGAQDVDVDDLTDDPMGVTELKKPRLRCEI